jgi:hypothetical protein
MPSIFECVYARAFLLSACESVCEECGSVCQCICERVVKSVWRHKLL